MLNVANFQHRSIWLCGVYFRTVLPSSTPPPATTVWSSSHMSGLFIFISRYLLRRFAIGITMLTQLGRISPKPSLLQLNIGRWCERRWLWRPPDIRPNVRYSRRSTSGRRVYHLWLVWLVLLLNSQAISPISMITCSWKTLVSFYIPSRHLAILFNGGPELEAP